MPQKRQPKNASVKPVDDGSVLYISFGLIVFRSAPFGKHVGRRKKGEDLFKADRRRTKVRRGRIWAKERQNNRKTKGAEGSRHMKQRFHKCFIVQKRCCCVLYYCLSVCAFRQARGAQEKRRRFVQSRPTAYKGTSRSDLGKRKTKQSKNEGSRRVPTYETALPQVFYRAETLLLRFILLSFGLRLFNKPYMPRIARRILM